MGGRSSSSSESTNTTTNIDKKIAVDSGIGVSADSSNVTVNVTDQGAIAGAIDLAKFSEQVGADNYDNLLSLTGSAIGSIFDAVSRNTQFVENAGKQVAQAYEKVNADTTGQNFKQVLMVASVGLVAFAVVKIAGK